jgi:hypothetical protein
MRPKEVLIELEANGHHVLGPQPLQTVADALAYEVRRGWLTKPRRGQYQARVSLLSASSLKRIEQWEHETNSWTERTRVRGCCG